MAVTIEDHHALMTQVAAGDERAFATLSRALGQDMFALACRLLNNEAEAEDALQEALIKLWKSAAKWTPDAKVSTYAYRLTYTTCIDLMRKRKNTVDIDTTPDQGAPETATQQVFDREREDHIKTALATLPDNQRTAVVMTYFMELNQAETASAMNTSTRAVEGLLARARKTLKPHVSQQWIGELS